jgi:murein DD-endopeptidase MepM/ murein hydrolase activator NlpD
MSGRSAGLLTFVALVAVMGGFALLLLRNAEQRAPIQVIIPTQSEPTSALDGWQLVLEAGFNDGNTAVPTIPIPEQRFVAPTLPAAQDLTPTLVGAADLGGAQLFTLEPGGVGATPTRLPSSPTPDPGGIAASPQPTVQERFVPVPTGSPQPPQLSVPRNMDPLGRDHYWFRRPVDSFGWNFALPSYAYGSDGPQADNPLRIHHGIDMPNPEGTTIRAGASGTVVFASSPEQPYFQNSSSYGNVVVIEHDFGWENGEPMFTLYAHMLSPLVETGQRVEAGDPIGLSGNTGRTSGSHVHFEVRIGENRYGRTYNPILWMAPYVGHGTIAGSYIDARDEFVDDATVTIRDWATGLIVSTTTTYVFDDTVNQVNPDPIWQENFAVGDLQAGRYEVSVTHDGQRLTGVVDVFEGRTTFVELKPNQPTVSEPETDASENNGG